MEKVCKTPLKIGIVGAGFSGTALAATLQRMQGNRAIDITLFDKSGTFGYGPAYSTPFPHHLLNVRAEDMSPFQDDLGHFTRWLSQQETLVATLKSEQPLAKQFVPRCYYAQYLQSLLATMRTENSFTCEPSEVIDVQLAGRQVKLIQRDGESRLVDKVVLALGNNSPSAFLFKVSHDTQCIENPWDYRAVSQVGQQDPVLIVGTGLSMIDAVLSLHHQQHQGAIYTVSRHGLLPLKHSDSQGQHPLSASELPLELTQLTKHLRSLSAEKMEAGGDWRVIMNGFRHHVPTWWQRSSLRDKRSFLRHALPYWNIHRHRVHTDIMELLERMMADQQLIVLAGRIQSVNAGYAEIKRRHTKEVMTFPVKYLINCMGPTQHLQTESQPLVHSLLAQGLAVLDPLALGFAATKEGALCHPKGGQSNQFFTLGPPTKGVFWECGAVPEIRKQIDDLARHLLK